MTALACSKTIVLLEDDPPIRQLIRQFLEQQGYVLIEARNAEEALQLAEAHPQQIDVLVTNVVLPCMDGFELSRRFMTKHPEARVLFTSGHASESVAVRGGLKESGEQFLLKPFTRDQLMQKIRDVLEGSVSGRAALKPGTNR